MKYRNINRNRVHGPLHPRKTLARDGSPSPWLRRLAACLIFSATIVGASWFFGWNNMFQQIVLSGVTGVCISVSWLWSRIINDPRDSLMKDSILVSLRRGFLLAVASLGLSAVLMLAADLFPTYDRYLDQDRPDIEQQIALLVSANNHQMATKLVSQRLSKPISDTWRQSLQELHVEILTQAGRSTIDPQHQQSLCEEAITAGKRYGIPTEEPQLRLRNLLDNQKYSQELNRLTREVAAV